MEMTMAFYPARLKTITKNTNDTHTDTGGTGMEKSSSNLLKTQTYTQARRQKGGGGFPDNFLHFTDRWHYTHGVILKWLSS